MRDDASNPTLGAMPHIPGMPDRPRASPDAIDTRLVFRLYAWLAIPAGVYVYLWPRLADGLALGIEGMPWGRYALVRTAAALVAGAGVCAAAFASIDDPIGRRRGMLVFAIAHLAFGLMWFIQWHAILSPALPRLVGWAPLLAGIILLYLALTAPATTPVRRLFTLLGPHEARPQRGVLVDMRLEALDALRSQYEEQIRQTTRQEERSRLARDLHDAVKQQLFVIQTAAATAEARFDADAPGAKSAVGQIRQAAREAIVEMQAMIEQLQAAPMENVGLTEALKQQCEALGFRTGADVKFHVGHLPPSEALPPGAQLALFRAAQEALANIGRHARAHHVDVTLELAGNRLGLAVVDDGVGFNPAEAKDGMGIRNMAARATEIGGSFMLRSSPGTGASVRLSVPCNTYVPGDYGRKALAWAAFLSLVLARASMKGMSESFADPLSIATAAIVAIMVARYTAAYVRLSRRPAPA